MTEGLESLEAMLKDRASDASHWLRLAVVDDTGGGAVSAVVRNARLRRVMPDLVAKAAAKVLQLRVPSETSITAVCEGLLDVIRSLMNVPPPGKPDGFPAQLGERPDDIVEAVCRRARSILEIVGWVANN